VGSVIIDWANFLPALFLLLTPVAVLQGPRVRLREIDRPWDRHWPQIRSLWLHYFDFARGAAGAWLLLDTVTVAPGAHGLARHAAVLVPAAIRVLASLLQTCFCKEPGAFNAPFAFLTGLLIVGPPPIVLAVSMVLVLTFTLGARSPASYFPLLAVVFPAAGTFFEGKEALLNFLPGSCAALLPWMCSLLFHRDLAVSYRSTRTTRTEPPFSPSAQKSQARVENSR
jgi:hypothetical protein